MSVARDTRSRKTAANLSIDAELLRTARDFGINLSATLEQALADAIRKRRRERWRAENEAAIAGYNELVEEHGVFSEGTRTF